MRSDKASFFELNQDFLVIAGLAVLVLAIYAQAGGFEYINLDDNHYVYENAAILSGLNGESVKWAFSAFHAGNWHPLTWISLGSTFSLFWCIAGKQHVVSVVIHLINSIPAFAVFSSNVGRLGECRYCRAICGHIQCTSSLLPGSPSGRICSPLLSGCCDVFYIG